MKMSENLKILMKQKRIKSLRELSQLSKIPTSSLHHIANGRKTTDILALSRLAETLEVSLYFLLFGKPDPIGDSGLSEKIMKEIFSGDFQVEMKIKKKI